MTEQEIADQIHDMGRRACKASHELVKLNTAQKNRILLAMADALLDQAAAILEANAKDLERAETNGLTKAMIDRLRLNPERLEGIANALREVAELPDPVGEVLEEFTRPNGLRIEKVRVPIGVIGIIFESRPNVTSDAASLCFKTGNATIQIVRWPQPCNRGEKRRGCPRTASNSSRSPTGRASISWRRWTTAST